MTSREKVQQVLSHKSVKGVALDLGATPMTGIHVNCVDGHPCGRHEFPACYGFHLRPLCGTAYATRTVANITLIKYRIRPATPMFCLTIDLLSNTVMRTIHSNIQHSNSIPNPTVALGKNSAYGGHDGATQFPENM
jgi:hypothetical protein